MTNQNAKWKDFDWSSVDWKAYAERKNREFRDRLYAEAEAEMRAFEEETMRRERREHRIAAVAGVIVVIGYCIASYFEGLYGLR